LDSPASYREVLNALAKKWANRGRLEVLEISGLTLVELRSRSEPLARLLAKTVSKGEYQFSPLVPIIARVEGKLRTLYRPNLLDFAVLAVAAKYFTAVSEPHLSPNLHSYRKGHSPWRAIRGLGEYLNEHARTVPLKGRGLYVLRRDIQKYGDNISNSPESMLFAQLERVLVTDTNAHQRAVARTLLTAALCQPVTQSDGTAAPLERGIPTGSPIQPPCGNLYLAGVDETLAAIPGAFYARFGDDILFMHPSATVCCDASTKLTEHIATLGLDFNLHKQRDFYWTGAGRPSIDDTHFAPTAQVEYLGASIAFKGGIGAKREKTRLLQRQLAQRLRHVAEIAGDVEKGTLVELLCSAVAHALEPTDPLALSCAEFLRHLSSDRGQLKDFDYRIALLVAELVTRRRGPRAFRELSYRELRQCGLPSLVLARQRKPAAQGQRP
jgi:hypothetical protein